MAVCRWHGRAQGLLTREGPIMPAFNHRVLREWRLDSGKTLEEVAFRAQISYPYLRRLEDLGGNPSAAVLARIAGVYGHEPGELFTDDDATPAGAR
jgi:transcriptional regulator with XRE-family HTH domain